VLAVLYYGMPRLELTAKPDVDLDIVVVSLRSTEYHSGSGCAEREFLVPEKGGFDAGGTLSSSGDVHSIISLVRSPAGSTRLDGPRSS
jgi:hypothetical protein